MIVNVAKRFDVYPRKRHTRIQVVVDTDRTLIPQNTTTKLGITDDEELFNLSTSIDYKRNLSLGSRISSRSVIF